MPASENPQLRHSTDDSSLTPISSVAGDVSASKNARISAVYIEPPPLPRAERVKYEAVSNRELPQDFDYGLPLSDRVIIGEYRDDTTLWYYVENADGVAHRFEASAFAEAFPYPVSEYSEKITVLLWHTSKWSIPTVTS